MVSRAAGHASYVILNDASSLAGKNFDRDDHGEFMVLHAYRAEIS